MSENTKTLKTQRSTTKENQYLDCLEEYIQSSPFTGVDKFRNFTKYIPRQSLTGFLCKQELFQKVLDVNGSIVECGVFQGGGLMSWAQMSSIYEPNNLSRRIIGFDSFEGFPSISKQDEGEGDDQAKVGGFCANNSYDDIQKAVDLYDQNRAIGHLPKIELVKGDANKTIPEFVQQNPYLVISLLYLDFDIYEPTKTALKYLFSRMPKGAVIAFDELNAPHWPGETVAVLEEIGISNLRIKRFPYASYISYAVIE